MSEPITLTERERVAAATAVRDFMAGVADVLRGRDHDKGRRADLSDAIEQVCRESVAWGFAESASPPRVPGASAQALSEGVESGSGQPIDAREAIRQAMYAVEAMPADTRLTDAVNFLQHAKMRVDHFIEGIQQAPLNMIISAAEINRLYALEREAAATIRKLREQVKTERRAGLEAAAKYHDDQAAEWSEHYTKNGNDPSAREYAKQHSADAAAIRALAATPEVRGG